MVDLCSFCRVINFICRQTVEKKNRELKCVIETIRSCV